MELNRLRQLAGIISEEATTRDAIEYHHPGGKKATDHADLNGSEVDPDTNTIIVQNRTSLADTHNALQKAGWKKKRFIKNHIKQGAAQQAGDTPYQLGDK